jgi:hypothetical protein
MKTHLILPLGVALILGGCASEKGGDVYSRDQVQQVQHFKVGTVESVHDVHIEGTKSPIGSTAGAVAGGCAFSCPVGSSAIMKLVNLRSANSLRGRGGHSSHAKDSLPSREQNFFGHRRGAHAAGPDRL